MKETREIWIGQYEKIALEPWRDNKNKRQCATITNVVDPHGQAITDSAIMFAGSQVKALDLAPGDKIQFSATLKDGILLSVRCLKRFDPRNPPEPKPAPRRKRKRRKLAKPTPRPARRELIARPHVLTVCSKLDKLTNQLIRNSDNLGFLELDGTCLQCSLSGSCNLGALRTSALSNAKFKLTSVLDAGKVLV